MRIRWLSPLVAAVLLVSIVLGHSGVFAQQTVDFGATPAATPAAVEAPVFGIIAVGDFPNGFFDDVEVTQGSSVELTAAFVNTGTVPVNLRSFKVNALSGPNGGFVAGEENDSPIGATAWIDFEPYEFALDANEQLGLRFTVTVPEDAQPGQYISGLAAVTTDEYAIPGSSMLTQARAYYISVGILVPGELTHSFELGTPTVEDAAIVIPIANTGNYLVRPAGELTLTNANGEISHRSMIEMGSVYAALATTVVAGIPAQTPPGDYLVNLSLTDPASGATAEVKDASITIAATEQTTGVTATTVTVEPTGEPIAFANVQVTLNNGGEYLQAANVVLNVFFNGEPLETFPLATNQVLPVGETQLTARYIPLDLWQSGTYTFEIVVSAVDPSGGAETVLATIPVEDQIVVP
jgi:hypothetical protein